jgi:hypothetical protein
MLKFYRVFICICQGWSSRDITFIAVETTAKNTEALTKLLVGPFMQICLKFWANGELKYFIAHNFDIFGCHFKLKQYRVYICTCFIYYIANYYINWLIGIRKYIRIKIFILYKLLLFFFYKHVFAYSTLPHKIRICIMKRNRLRSWNTLKKLGNKT